MIYRFGMSDALGPMTFGGGGRTRFLGLAIDAEERNFSEETARLIDREMKTLLRARESAL